ncbi:MAG: hypothetical protein COU08_00485 [Candidatus Harrisonbacteria bacterium CG10_big_fil_rev_8_21_14_0_10_42_17]|uniref:Uncharacterized protein n=1 Tax=Candidatus Harrisonbacteria bacterium CG10_big_fil_rev_8_21_14_0_10_42_17 TaxID=1974584 RepID=A0A2M6WJ12_9BACT|nr:MAG: hypothetical protein COU08_00485 [Candidatus Harrisonbacteria bacterium CG10_big_fil_rev_8_21_14_0_10_42_17]
MKKNSEHNLKDTLTKLSKIVDWFENLEEVDIEEGIEKTKEASLLIASAKVRLGEIANEFEEIQKTIEEN